MSASSPIPCVCSGGGGGSATALTGNGGGGNGGSNGDCYWAGGGGVGGLGGNPSGNGQANSVTSAASGQANSVTSVLTSVSSAPAAGEAFQGERGKNESGAQIVEWNMFSEDTKDHFGPLESADDRELNPDDRGLRHNKEVVATRNRLLMSKFSHTYLLTFTQYI